LLTAGDDAHEVVRGVTPSFGVYVYISRPNVPVFVIMAWRVPRWSTMSPVASNCSAVGSLATAPGQGDVGVGDIDVRLLARNSRDSEDDPA
jgi:hypothetical protein